MLSKLQKYDEEHKAALLIEERKVAGPIAACFAFALVCTLLDFSYLVPLGPIVATVLMFTSYEPLWKERFTRRAGGHEVLTVALLNCLIEAGLGEMPVELKLSLVHPEGFISSFIQKVRMELGRGLHRFSSFFQVTPGSVWKAVWESMILRLDGSPFLPDRLFERKFLPANPSPDDLEASLDFLEARVPLGHQSELRIKAWIKVVAIEKQHWLKHKEWDSGAQAVKNHRSKIYSYEHRADFLGEFSVGSSTARHVQLVGSHAGRTKPEPQELLKQVTTRLNRRGPEEVINSATSELLRGLDSALKRLQAAA